MPKPNYKCQDCATIQGVEWELSPLPSCYVHRPCQKKRTYYKHHAVNKAIQLGYHRYNKYRNDHCALCDSRVDLHTHHIKPQSSKGEDSKMNTLTLCKPCHRIISNYYKIVGWVK